MDLNFPVQQEELRLQEFPTTTLLEPQNPYSNQKQGDSDGKNSDEKNSKVKSSNKVNSSRESFNSVWSAQPLLNSSTATETEREGGSQGRHLGQVYSNHKEEEKEEEQQRQQQQQRQHSTLHDAFSIGAGTQEDWPQPEGIRLLVAITSACCTQVSLQRRAAIRRTWAALIKERYRNSDSGSISILFFLAQPENETTLSEWFPALKEEIIAHNDTVVLRGKDAYLNLPNKTFRMLRYILADPREYTHVLKADDDTWVRMHKVLEYLQEKQPMGSAGFGGSEAAAAAVQRKVELERMSRDRGAPIVSEGMTLYDATSIVQRVDQDPRHAKESVDDIDGSQLTLAELGKRKMWHLHRIDEGETQEKGSGGSSFLMGKRHLLQQQQEQQEQKQQFGSSSSFSSSSRPRMSGVYLGCIENQRGFQPIRDPNNKWYVSEQDLPNDSYPHGVKYLAGWGYLLSRDLVMHIVQKVKSYESQPELAPLWYSRIAFEDVLVGLLLHDVVPLPESHSGFRPAWRSCVPDTAVRH